jgi:hypothetical protein
LENLTNEEQIYTVTLSTTDRTPPDWSADFISGSTIITTSDTNDATDQIIVPADSKTEFSLTLKIGSTLGIGDAKVIIELEGTPTVKRSRMISGITNEIENVLLETGPDYSLQPYINIGANNITILEAGDYLSFANDLPNVKLVIWNKGPSESLSPDEIDFIKNTQNVNHFICGDRVIYSLVITDDLGFFGLEWIGWNLEARGSIGTIRISGQENDVITGDLGENIEGCLIQYYINMVRITDARNVFPIMHFQDNGNRQYNNQVYFITAVDTVFGIRSTMNNARTVLFGITPYVITDENIRQTLINNVLDWLTGKI